MSISARLNEQLKSAMRSKDKRSLQVIRMVKSKMTERKTRKGFSGEENDALWLEVIAAYYKSQKKGLQIYQELNASDEIRELEWELAWLETFLPKKADEETLRLWVAEALAGMGPSPNFGQVMGAVMRLHKAEVDPNTLRALIKEALA